MEQKKRKARTPCTQPKPPRQALTVTQPCRLSISHGYEALRMLRIQVGHSYFMRYDRKQWERGKPYPPLATIQVAALLRQMGHQISLFDAMLAEGVEDYAHTLHGATPDVVVFYEDNFNYLTKMCLSRMREA